MHGLKDVSIELTLPTKTQAQPTDAPVIKVANQIGSSDNIHGVLMRNQVKES